MSATALTALIARCRTLCPRRPQTPDAELLRRFAQQRDAAAFGELLERYAPLVWGVCRRILPVEADCEDAFQAAFLALLRQADAPDPSRPLGGWLHTVSVRVAHKVLSRSRRQRSGAVLPERAMPGDVADEVSSRELFRVVDEEIERLPIRVRVPIILCCLEGRTRDEAAELMGCSVAAVKGRLERGRGILRRRLERRGIGLPAAFLVLGLTSERIRASLWAKTIQSILYAPSPAVAALAQAGLPAMSAGTLKLALAGLATLVVTAGAAGVIGQVLTEKPTETPAEPPQAKAAAEPKKPAPSRVRTDRHGDPLPDDAIARLGTVRWRHGWGIQALAYSPDGKIIAATGGGRGTTLWDAATGKEVRRFPKICDPKGLAFSPDGKMLATTGYPFCYLWDVATGKEVWRLKDIENSVLSPAFSPDGKLVATVFGAGNGTVGGTVCLWDSATGKERRRLKEGSSYVCRLAYSPDAKWIALARADGVINLWDPNTGEQHRRLTGHKKEIRHISFSPDGKRLASSSLDETIRLWNVATGRQSRILAEKLGEHDDKPITFSPDGMLLASGYRDGTIQLWNVEDGTEKRRWQTGARTVSAIAFSPDGKTLASGSEGNSIGDSIRLWDVATGRERHPSEEHRGSIEFVRFSSDGASLISIGNDRRMLWWDVAMQTPRRQFTWSAKARGEVALSPDGNTLAEARFQGYGVRLWDTRTGKPGRLLGKHQGMFWSVAYSPDGRLVASTGVDDLLEGFICIWDTSNGKEIRRIVGLQNNDVMPLCFSPDSKALACSTYLAGDVSAKSTLHLWDLASGKERCVFDMCFPHASALAFSPDGKVIVAGGDFEGPLVHLWDTVTGKELCRHTGHRDGIGAVAFSPDGKLVASGAGVTGEDNSVRVWEAATGRLLLRFEGHHSCVFNVAFSPDGLTVASGAGDSTVLLWDITGRRTDGRWHGKLLTPRELDACWIALKDEDAAKAYDAVWTLVASAEQALPLLRKHLRPVPCPDTKIVTRLIADLDSDNFNVRQHAMKELSKLGDIIIPDLRRVLDGKPTLEMRRRLQLLLDRPRDWTPEHLREHRALQALEHIGTQAARQLLEALAGGAPEARLTEEAKAVLRRLAR